MSMGRMFAIRYFLLLVMALPAVPTLSYAQTEEDKQQFQALASQIGDMRRELASMRQVLQQQENKISRLERRLNQNYIEFNRRLQDGNAGAVAATPGASDGTGLVATAPVEGDFRTRLQVSLGFMESGQLETARNTLSELLLLSPEHVEAPLAWYWLGELHLQLEHYDDAEQAFSYLIAVYEQHWRVPAAAFKLGEVYRVRGHDQKARVQYSRVVERYPDSPAARLADLALDVLDRRNH